MGYTFSFTDDALYSAEDINNITKRLVSSGVEDSFENGLPYNVGRLNNISRPLVTDGVIPEENESLKVIKEDDGKIKILSGTAFMESGATITVDEEGVVLEYTKNAENYVFMEDNESLGQIIPKASTSLPVGYSYVLLATINKDGTITDNRKYAKGKLPGYMSDFNTPKRVELRIDGTGEYEVDIGRTEFNVVIIHETGQRLTSNGYDAIAIWNRFDNKYISSTCYRKGLDISDTYFYLTPSYTGTAYMFLAEMSFEGTKMRLKFTTQTGTETIWPSVFQITVL